MTAAGAGPDNDIQRSPSQEVTATSACSSAPGGGTGTPSADQGILISAVIRGWSALGVPVPPPGAPLHAEVAVTSWDGDRWMSLSGPAPAAVMNDPAGWRAMRLGDGARMIETGPPPPGRAPG